MRRILAVVIGIAGCGRFDFDPATGANGERWLQVFDGATKVIVAGTGGETVAAADFVSTLRVAGMTLTATAPVQSGAVIRFDRTGAVRSTSVFDATIACDLRGVAMRGDDALVTGYGFGAADASLGACGFASGSQQDPIEIRVDPDGNQNLLASWPASGNNGQGFHTATFADGTIAMSGIYGVDLTIGTPLPTAGIDPNAFVTRFADGASSAIWAVPLVSTAQVTPGALAADGDELCMLVAYNGPSTLFGTQLTSAGGFDELLSRLDATGNPRFVRAVGSSGDEGGWGAGSVLATPDGCIFAFDAAGDLTIDGVALPASAGGAVIVELDLAGGLVGAARVPEAAEPPITSAGAHLAMVGGRLVGVLTIDAAVTIGGETYTPAGRDVIVVDIDPKRGATQILGAVGGAGDQTLSWFESIGPDAVAIAVSSTGGLAFGPSTFDSGTNTVYAVAALGIAP